MTHDAGGGPGLAVETSGGGVSLQCRAISGGGGGDRIGCCLDQNEVSCSSEGHTLTGGGGEEGGGRGRGRGRGRGELEGDQQRKLFIYLPSLWNGTRSHRHSVPHVVPTWNGIETGRVGNLNLDDLSWERHSHYGGVPLSRLGGERHKRF